MKTVTKDNKRKNEVVVTFAFGENMLAVNRTDKGIESNRTLKFARLNNIFVKPVAVYRFVSVSRVRCVLLLRFFSR